MRQIIYVDILILTNAAINYLLLLLTGIISARDFRRVRLLIAAFLSAFFSLNIFLPPLSPLLLVGFRLLAGVGTVFLGFGWRSGKKFFQNLLFFGVISFAFGGSMAGIWFLLTPDGMVYQNGSVYFNISMPILIGTAVVVYSLLRIALYLLRKKVDHPKKHLQLYAQRNGREILAEGIVDTGNSLTELFSGLPVIVIDQKAALPLLTVAEQNQLRSLQSGMPRGGRGSLRLIPYESVGGDGLLPAILPEQLILRDAEGCEFAVSAYLALSEQKLRGDYAALIHPGCFTEDSLKENTKGGRTYAPHLSAQSNNDHPDPDLPAGRDSLHKRSGGTSPSPDPGGRGRSTFDSEKRPEVCPANSDCP
ncbi:MAG: hypothetical protein E7486_04265 [Ruminococcaceae bacterium]|nr:hypothetical protein [Oscillospiraceae bacterium]